MIISFGGVNGNMLLITVNRKIAVLDEMVAELATAGPAQRSWNNFISQTNKYKRFCQTLQLFPFPLTDNNLCQYIAFLTLTMTSFNSVQAYINGVRKLHIYAKINWMAMIPYAELVVDGVNRVLSHVAKQAEPMTPKILSQIQPPVDRRDPWQVVCFTAMLIPFCLFLRSSNVVSSSNSNYDPTRQLSRCDFRVSENLILTHIKWSKT